MARVFQSATQGAQDLRAFLAVSAKLAEAPAEKITWSRQSRRRVPFRRSQMALARGDRGGVIKQRVPQLFTGCEIPYRRSNHGRGS
jgi:hypothetical protein